MPDTVRFRFARPDDIPDVVRLVTHSFPGATRPPEWWRDQLASPVHGGGADTLLVGEQHGRKVAALQLHPLQQCIAATSFATAGVGTVTIAPTHRRRGLARLLMTEALNAALARGDVASLLYPFRTSFYRRLGYGAAGEVQQFLVPPEVLPDSNERLRVELLEGDGPLREALALYGRWLRTQNGQLQRGEPLWVQLARAHDRVLVGYRGDGRALEGYALATYRTDLPPPDRFLEVDELVWTTPRARQGLYAWLGSLGDQWPRLLIRSLPSHRFADWIAEPRLPRGSGPLWRLWEPAATVLMGPMFRLLDAEVAWSRRRINEGAAASFHVYVEDAQLPANAGDWTMVLEEGSAALRRRSGGTTVLRMDVSTLSRLFIAALSPTAAFEAGLLECDRPERLPALDAALALPEPWCFDRF